jgi:hypothetical protein
MYFVRREILSHNKICLGGLYYFSLTHVPFMLMNYRKLKRNAVPKFTNMMSQFPTHSKELQMSFNFSRSNFTTMGLVETVDHLIDLYNFGISLKWIHNPS